MKTVLITGGSRGIGQACVLAFARAGWQVAFSYHTQAEQAGQLVERVRQQGGAAACWQADVADSSQVDRLFARAEEAFGPIDALVCNAGIAHQGLLTDMTDAQWRRLMGVDLDGAFYCCRRALPAMVRRHQGSVVLISSTWGVTGGSCEAAYSAAKAGLIGLAKALAKEMGPSGIRVNCIAPGVIDTEMNGGLTEEDLAALREETPLGRQGAPEEVAEAALFLCGEGARFITGQVLGVDGGIAV